jgi:pimeloyl-ACP methyl ester carboxylesterase
MCTNDISANPRGYQSPSDHNMPYKEVKITTKDKIKLYGWFIYQNDSNNRTTIIYFHENAGNLGFRLPFAKLLFARLKVNILVVGYRGYGYSEGLPTEEGLMLDSEAVIEYAFNDLSDMINVDDVYIFGRSLGGAVSIYIVEKLAPKVFIED